MVRVERNVPAQDIRQSAKHVLFVEGEDEDAIDKQVLQSLLPRQLSIECLGPSFHVRSVAEALYTHHPSYYFLIDRDHYTDEFVQASWDNFPDPATSNLLVWHRREIENYFLIPEYLVNSQYLKVSKDELCSKIIQCCRERLFIDVVNQVIIWAREELKQKWIVCFTCLMDFSTKDKAIRMLTSKPEWNMKTENTVSSLCQRSLEDKFEEYYQLFCQGQENLDFGKGLWLERISGKKVFSVIANGCFKVTDSSDKDVQGRAQRNRIASNLASMDLQIQPEDFQRLHNMIDNRIHSE